VWIFFGFREDAEQKQKAEYERWRETDVALRAEKKKT